MRAFGIILGFALFVSAMSAASCGHKTTKAEPISPRDGVFAIDDKDIGANEVRFYCFETGGKSVVFFVARGPSGVIKTAFDACQTCYPHRMGYRHEKGCVVCAYCGMPIKIDDLEKGEGNCVPIAVPHRLSGGKVLIDRKDVEEGMRLF